MIGQETFEGDYRETAMVQFETRTKEDRTASLEAGHFVAQNVDFAIITPAGGNLIMEREVDDEIRARFGRQYNAWKEGREMPVDGISIKNWPVLSPAQVENLLNVNVRTVEELASLNEAGLGRVGMGGRALQQKAKAWLESAKGDGKAAATIEKLEVELQASRDRIKDLEQSLRSVGADDIEKVKAAYAKLQTDSEALAEAAEKEIESLKAKLKQKRSRKKKE